MSDLDPRLTDFRNFLYLVWSHLDLPSPTPAQYDIAHYLANGPQSRMVQAFRGIGKTWITAAYAAWRLLINPNERILIVSASGKYADKVAYFLKRLIHEMPILQHLRATADQRDSANEFDVGPCSVNPTPSVRSVGIGGQMTGGRATLIIADDVEVPKNSATVDMREKLAGLVSEFEDLLVPKVGEVVYLGTPQSEETIYKLLPERGYEIRVWTARIPEKSEKYGDTLAPYIRRLIDKGARPGDPTDTRFSDTDLRRRELSGGRSRWHLQYMLDTQLSDAERYPLKCSDFIVMPCGGEMGPVKLSWASGPELVVKDLPMMGFSRDRFYRPIFTAREFENWQGVVMSIDPSGTGKDETGYAVVKMLSGNLYVSEAKGLRGGYKQENLEALAHAARRNRVNKIIIEGNFGDGMFTQLFLPVLAKIYQCSVEDVKHSSQKERRIIDTLEPVMNQHRLVVDPAVILEDAKNYNEHPEEKANQYSLVYQLTHITSEKGSLRHDDRLDALAIAVAHWTEVMAKDDTHEIVAAKQRRFDDDLRRWTEDLGVGSFGGAQQDTWV